MTLNELIGCNSYPCYGGGGAFSSGWLPMTIQGFDVIKSGGQRVYTIDKLYPFKLQRFFVDNFIFTNKDSINTEPTTSGNLYYDTYFKLCKAHGIQTWWAPAGVFSWYEMPTNPSTGKTYSRRKSIPIPHYKNGTHGDPFKKETWDDIANHSKRIAEHYKGTGLLDYLELVGNEVIDFPWNTLLTGTPQIAAEGAYWCYKAVESIGTDLKLILPSGTSWNLERLRELPFYLKKKFESMGDVFPENRFYLTSHNYMNDAAQNQGGASTTGITPEDAQIHLWGKGVDSICRDYKLLGCLIGETGYGVDNDGQHAPDLEGLNRWQSQALCNLRTALILGAASEYFRGVAYYHCRHLFDQGKYDYTGYSDKNWNWTEAMFITVDFKEKYGEFTPIEYSFVNQVSTVKLQKGTEVKYLQWTNKKNAGTLTPNFKEVTEPQPTTEPITSKTFSNKKLLLNGKYKIQFP